MRPKVKKQSTAWMFTNEPNQTEIVHAWIISKKMFACFFFLKSNRLQSHYYNSTEQLILSKTVRGNASPSTMNFWAFNASIWRVINRTVLTARRITSSYSRTFIIYQRVTVFRHVKRRLIPLEWMFLRYLNWSGHSTLTTDVSPNTNPVTCC